MVWILIVMLLTGAVGGLAGFLVRSQSDEKSTPTDVSGGRVTVWPDIVVGVVASFCVPVFLLVTQSKLLDELQTDLNKNANPFFELLYLGGFCLIAAFSSHTFLQSISGLVLKIDKLRGKTQELADAQDKLADNVAEIEAESTNTAIQTHAQPLAPENSDNSQPPISAVVDELSEPDKEVLLALNSPRYSWRSLTGVTRDAGTSKIQAKYSLDKLKDQKLVAYRLSDRTNKPLYALTHKGVTRVRDFCKE